MRHQLPQARPLLHLRRPQLPPPRRRHADQLLGSRKHPRDVERREEYGWSDSQCAERRPRKSPADPLLGGRLQRNSSQTVVRRTWGVRVRPPSQVQPRLGDPVRQSPPVDRPLRLLHQRRKGTADSQAGQRMVPNPPVLSGAHIPLPSFKASVPSVEPRRGQAVLRAILRGVRHSEMALQERVGRRRQGRAGARACAVVGGEELVVETRRGGSHVCAGQDIVGL